MAQEANQIRCLMEYEEQDSPFVQDSILSGKSKNRDTRGTSSISLNSSSYWSRAHSKKYKLFSRFRAILIIVVFVARIVDSFHLVELLPLVGREIERARKVTHLLVLESSHINTTTQNHACQLRGADLSIVDGEEVICRHIDLDISVSFLSYVALS